MIEYSLGIAQNKMKYTYKGIFDTSIFFHQNMLFSKPKIFATSGEDNGGWCPSSSDSNPWLEVRLSKPMAVSGLNFQHPSQKDGFTYPSMFMKTFQLKFISALDSLQQWRSFNEVHENI